MLAMSLPGYGKALRSQHRVLGVNNSAPVCVPGLQNVNIILLWWLLLPRKCRARRPSVALKLRETCYELPKATDWHKDAKKCHERNINESSTDAHRYTYPSSPLPKCAWLNLRSNLGRGAKPAIHAQADVKHPADLHGCLYAPRRHRATV